MPLLKGEGLKMLTPNKQLTRLSILLAQVKATNNSNNLKLKLGKYYIFRISIAKSPERFTKI